MATVPAFFRKHETPAGPIEAPHTVSRPARVPAQDDLYRLRALPQDDVFFYCKRIDNSRLVREADPQARGACWSAIGAASVLLVVLTTAFAPMVMTTVAGYKLEALHSEERRLQEELRVLELQKAEVVSPARMDQLARQNNLVTPSSSQVVHLDKPGGTVAMVK
jgi:cell division protein FtsL